MQDRKQQVPYLETSALMESGKWVSKHGLWKNLKNHLKSAQDMQLMD